MELVNLLDHQWLPTEIKALVQLGRYCMMTSTRLKQSSWAQITNHAVAQKITKLFVQAQTHATLFPYL